METYGWTSKRKQNIELLLFQVCIVHQEPQIKWRLYGKEQHAVKDNHVDMQKGLWKSQPLELPYIRVLNLATILMSFD